MSRKLWLLLLLFVLTLGLDQGSKAVVRTFELGASHVWISGLFMTVHLENPGGVLGLAASWPLALKLGLFLAAATGMGLVAFLWLARVPRSSVVVPVGLGALLGGAAGNSLDRVIYGSVTDFLVLGDAAVTLVLPWIPGVEQTPAFNLADAFLGAGIVVLALQVFWTLLRGVSPSPLPDPEEG